MDKVYLQWEGRRSVARAKKALAERECVEIHLPANLNHTLFERFCPDAVLGEIEEFDIRGGAEIIEQLALEKTLYDLNQLAPSARDTHAEVRIISPTPRLIVSPPV